jgi:hypothetical protein
VQLKRILFNTSDNSICICIEFDDNFRQLQLIQILSIKGPTAGNAADFARGMVGINRGDRVVGGAPAPLSVSPRAFEAPKRANPALFGFTVW